MVENVNNKPSMPPQPPINKSNELAKKIWAKIKTLSIPNKGILFLVVLGIIAAIVKKL